MRPQLRWLAGIVTLSVGVGILTLPDGGGRDAMSDGTAPGVLSHGPYIFGGFLILCSVACVMPVVFIRRAVAVGCAIFCFLLAGMAAENMAGVRAKMGAIESLEAIFVTCVIGAGTGFYAITGRLPSWLWIIFHRLPPKGDTVGTTGPAQHIEEDRRHCPRCSSETWHVARTYSNGDQIVECESCGRSVSEPVGD